MKKILRLSIVNVDFKILAKMNICTYIYRTQYLQIFTTQRDLDWHKEGEHDTVPKKCKFCGEVFVHGSSLTRHVRLKHEKSFVPSDKKSSLYAPCPICKQTFYKTSINKHIRIKHQVRTNPQFFGKLDIFDHYNIVDLIIFFSYYRVKNRLSVRFVSKDLLQNAT